MNVVTDKVMHQLNVVWGVKREGGDNPKRSNCIEKVYRWILNEKKTTVVNPNGTRNKRTPFLRRPYTRTNEVRRSIGLQAGKARILLEKQG